MNPRYSLDNLPNEALLVNLKQLVGSSNELTAHLLAHLAEVEGRGVYRDCACASLYTYCVYELRFSEDEAQRRCRAARVARQFPLILDMLADASIHLTGILLLAPHLTQANHVELLARARYRTKREIEKLVSEVAPRADAPSLIQPLGPPMPAQRAPATWAAFVSAWAGAVRDLVPGDGHGQAPLGALAWQGATGSADVPPAQDEAAAPARETLGSPGEPSTHPLGLSAAPAREGLGPPEERAAQPPGLSAAPAREAFESRAGEPLVGLRYRLQFTADQSYVDLLEQARDLLQHQVPDRDLARVHRLAIEALLEKLSKRKYSALGPKPSSARSGIPAGSQPDDTSAAAGAASTESTCARIHPPDTSVPSAELTPTPAPVSNPTCAKPGPAKPGPAEPTPAEPTPAEPGPAKSGPAEPTLAEPGRVELGRAESGPAEPTLAEPQSAAEPGLAQPHSADRADAESQCSESQCANPADPDRQRRHIPAALKRKVWERDGGRCTFTDARGERCRETRWLEFHHQEPYARGGSTRLDNVSLHCRSHNGLAAERDFGRDFIARRANAATGARARDPARC